MSAIRIPSQPRRSPVAVARERLWLGAFALVVLSAGALAGAGPADPERAGSDGAGSAAARFLVEEAARAETAQTETTPDQPDVSGLSGRELMDAVYARHQQYPFVFEEQSMVLVDRAGGREARRLRRYSRVEPDGTARILLLFESPKEVEGVALLASRSPAGAMDVSVYLPALGPDLIGSDSDGATSSFLGTDFTIENLTGEILDDYRYVRRHSRDVDGVPYHVVDVFDPDEDPSTARPLRRHFVRADNLFIARTDFYDELGRVERRQTFHDLHPVDGPMWRANMILIEDFRAHHSTLLRIEKRIFSRDYVPEAMFTPAWIVANHPPEQAPPEQAPEGGAPTGPDAGDEAPAEEDVGAALAAGAGVDDDSAARGSAGGGR